MGPMQGRDESGWRGNLSCAFRSSAPRWFAARSIRPRTRKGPCGRFGCPVPANGQGLGSLKAVAPPQTNSLLDGFCPEPGQEEQIALQTASGRLLFVQLANIDWLEAVANRTALHVGKEMHLLDDGLSAVAAKLPPDRFVSIGPSVLVRAEQLKAVRRTCLGRWRLLLYNGARLTLTSGLVGTLRQTSPCFSTSKDRLVSIRHPWTGPARS